MSDLINKQESSSCTHEDDTISRTAAIDYFVTNVGFHDEDGYPIEDSDELRKIWTEFFYGIPSAQPEKRTDKRTETHTCDCISREAAIDIVRHECGEWKGLSKEIVKQFNGLPPLETERKKGRWSGDFCSCCGVSKYNYISIRKEDGAVPAGTWNFCPKCGADMREVDADEQTD